MHPAIQPFLDLYNNNSLAIVTQAGFAGSTQSHFTDQDIIERGIFQATDGWLNRYLQAVGAAGAPAIRAAGMGSDLADSLRGTVLVPAVNDLTAFSFTRLNSCKGSDWNRTSEPSMGRTLHRRARILTADSSIP